MSRPRPAVSGRDGKGAAPGKNGGGGGDDQRSRSSSTHAPGAIMATLGDKVNPDGEAVLDIALLYLRAGLSVLPVRRDGTKAPACGSWKQFQEQPVDEAQARQWWGKGSPPGIAVLCGAASGGLEVIDFDREADALFPRWRALVEGAAPGLVERLTVVRTPGGGYHAWYRCGDMAPEGNTKLAGLSAAEQDEERALAEREGRKAALTLIETRGEGGYALVPGSPPECHQSRACYEVISGPPLWRPAEVSVAERDLLVAS